MHISTLLADPEAIRLDHIVSAEKSVTLVVTAGQPGARCPRCAVSSARVHSLYTRCVADLPWHGVAVRLELHARRFVCTTECCQQRIFCERLPSVVAAYARKTSRLTVALELIGFALGGEAGARLARQLGMHTSPDALLERIRRAALPQVSTPKILGIDDWAQRKGSTYGTILVDYERRRPVDLLPDREAGTLAHWLKAHPGVEIIIRDRAGAYADGARAGAPEAMQIADRWHLLKNISEVFERFLNRHRTILQQAVQNIHAESSEVASCTNTTNAVAANDNSLSPQQLVVEAHNIVNKKSSRHHEHL
ncbi:MAG: ISL3 family transposase, partial [Pyrinomonadaceae bacterium]